MRLSGAGVISREIDALLEEISPRSASLQFEESIPIGATIRLLYTESEEGGNLVGTVVDCMRHAQLGYFIEIRFVNGCTWSPQRFRPLHLFDPANLIAIARAAAGGQ